MIQSPKSSLLDCDDVWSNSRPLDNGQRRRRNDSRCFLSRQDQVFQKVDVVSDPFSAQTTHNALNGLGLCGLIEILSTMFPNKLTEQCETYRRIGILFDNILNLFGDLLSNLMEVSIGRREIVDPRTHEVRGEDQGHLRCWKQR